MAPLQSLLLVAGLALAQAQEAPKYTAEEYKAYQAVTTEADPAKKVDLAAAFIKERPESTLRQHVVAAYQGVMNDLQTGAKWNDLISSGDRFLAVVPDDIFTISLMATAYQKTGNNTKFVALGEKVFAKNPTGNLAYYLAKAYLDLKNDAKFLQWGEKTAEMLPDNHEILLEMTKKSGEARKNAAAAKYARQCIKAIQAASKPEAASEKDWKQYVSNTMATCYNIIGNVAFEAQDFAGAITNLENSLKYYGRNEIAFYHLGQSYWQQGKVDLAMKNFAKAYLLKGKTSAAAKQQLDNLYKSTHQQSLVGQERVIEKAKSELP
jgi:tetratricopeptide (TPR) repeat protein